ncbi:MAG: pyridoxal-phosphate dependent enzyme [Alphaproteobacteria bacterium]
MREELTMADLEAAAERVGRHVPPASVWRAPHLDPSCGGMVWVGDESHSPTGNVRVRGAVNYLVLLRQRRPCVRTVIAVSHGDHGRSVGWMAKRLGMAAVVVAPRTEAPERLAALRELGVDLILEGDDIEAAQEHAQVLSATRSQHLVPVFHKWLVQGVASAALDILREIPDLDALIVPVASGVALCGAIAARDAFGLKTRVYGVVAEASPAFALSFRAGRPVISPPPDEQALAMALDGAADIVTVAGENPDAALPALRDNLAGRRVVIL